MPLTPRGEEENLYIYNHIKGFYFCVQSICSKRISPGQLNGNQEHIKQYRLLHPDNCQRKSHIAGLSSSNHGINLAPLVTDICRIERILFSVFLQPWCKISIQRKRFSPSNPANFVLTPRRNLHLPRSVRVICPWFNSFASPRQAH